MNSSRLKHIFLATCVAVVVSTGSCTAGVVAFDNFGPNDSYDSWGNCQGSAFLDEMMLAQRFTPEFSGVLDKFELGFFYVGGLSAETMGNVDELTLALVPDVNGEPGTQELWAQIYLDKSPTNYGYVATFDVAGGPTLEAGTKYWLTSRSTSIGFRPHSWYRAPAPSEPLGLYYIRSEWPEGVGKWHTIPPTDGHGFALRVTVIPEPAAPTLMLAASAALVAMRRRTSP